MQEEIIVDEHLTAEEIKQLEEADREYERGETISHEDLKKKYGL